MNRVENNLTSAPIGGLIRQIAVPASVGFFFNTMFNVVDTVYGGLISTQAVAALSLSFPVFFTIIALGSGISTGASALIANALGSGDEVKAKSYGEQAISFSVIVALVLTFLGLLTAPFFSKILGAQGEYLDITLGYINIIFLGTIFFLLTFVLNSLLTARGDTKTFRNLLVGGFLLNVIFDPWFIYGGLGVPRMGLPGVAWATVLIQFLQALFYFWKVEKMGLISRKDWVNFIPRKEVFKEIARQGIPASLNMMTVAIGIFVITYYISRFGEKAVAAYGIATRIEQIALIPNIGLNIATLTLVGQNFGAGKIERIKSTIRTALGYGLFIVSVGVVLIYAFAKELIMIFSRDPEVVSIGAGYLHIAVFVYWAYIVLYIVVSALQGVKKPLFAFFIGLFRQIAGPLAVFYFFVKVLNLGIAGVWWGILLINWIAVGISLVYIISVMRKLAQMPVLKK